MFAAAAPAAAQVAAEPGAELTVYLATMGPGDSVWEQFGHNAIWIRDANTGSTISYNYGMFDFQQPGFVRRLMKGRMLYSMGLRDADEETSAYAYWNRSVVVQRLNLTPAQSHALREFLEWNWLPANRDYLYDPFTDNCSTRLRDALDRVLDGRLRAALVGVPAGTTFRSQSLRLTAGDVPTYTGLLLGLGMPTDRPLDLWDDAFIPMQLMQHIRAVRVPGPDGTDIPLVAEERTLFQATRAPERDAPPARSAWYLLAGLAMGGGILLLARGARREMAAAGDDGRSDSPGPRAAGRDGHTAARDVGSPATRRRTLALALTISLWGIITGFFGTLLALLWVATDHTYAWANQNLLQTSPLGLLLAVAAPLALARRAGGRLHAVARTAWPTALVLAALSVLGLAMHIVPGFGQASRPIIAFALPVHVAIVVALYRTLDRNPSSAEDVSARMPTAAAA